MSDHPLSDDELVSSYLDGELSVDERAHVDERLAAEPEFRERMVAIRAAESLASTPVNPLTSTDADRLIAAALAASSTAANITDLTAAGARRRAWPARVATVAAAVVALAIAVPALRAIDTGDDSDSAGDAATTADRSFDEAPADDGDADTANSFAEEAALSPAATGMDSDTTDAGDTDLDDTALDATTPEDVDDTDAEDDFGAGLAYSTDQLRLFRDDPDFDPLGDDLGDFDGIDALSAVVSQTWSGYQLAVPETTTTTAGTAPPQGGEPGFVERAEIDEAAMNRFDAFALDACADITDLIIEFFDDELVVAADYSSATGAGVPFAVGVFLLPGDQAVLLLIDLAACEVRDARLN